MKIFSISFLIAYTVAYLIPISPFFYYPAIRRFSFESLPAADAGPGMLWYAWLTCASFAALLASVLTPRRLADKVPPSATAFFAVVAIAVTLAYEMKWFT